MHKLTTQRQYTLRVDLKDWDGEARYADYGLFYVNDASTSYSLMLDYYLGGTLANSLLPIHNLMRFGTYNNDVPRNCGKVYWAGWWYGASSCFRANLNGIYRDDGNAQDYRGIIWSDWQLQHSFKESAMRIKPTF